jgi:hypothetical protein
MESDGLATGWRAYRAGELDEEDEEPVVLMFCAVC